ncbi:MAG: hypothetical protein SLRJCFUN_002574, partial [Candidatus Fervidibacter sp.]
EMEQGFAQAAERDEALRREFQQQIEGLRRETQQQVEGLRKEMERGFAEVAEQGEVLRREIVRLERWLFALTVPVLVGIVGIIGMLLQIMLK